MKRIFEQRWTKEAYQNPFYLNQIIGYLNLFGKISCDYPEIEKQWIAFSKANGTSYMIPSEYNLNKFVIYLKDVFE